MRRLMVLLAGSAVLLMSAGAFAQADNTQTKSEFIEFEGMLVDGEFKTPGGTLIEGQERAPFERLSDLKGETDFLSKVHESANSDSLK